MSDGGQGSSISERKNSLYHPQRLVSLSKAPQDSTLLLLALRGEVKFGVEEGLSMQTAFVMRTLAPNKTCISWHLVKIPIKHAYHGISSK